MRLFLLLPLAAIIGCAGTPPPISDEAFVHAIVALRRGASGVGTEAEFVPLRESILEREGVTEGELRAFVRVLAREPGELAAIWERIDAELRSESTGAAADTSRPAEGENR